MAEKPEDTQRQIEGLRADATATLGELERRLRGGVQGVAGGEARITATRAREQLVDRTTENPGLLAVAGTVAVAAVGYGIYALLGRRRESRKPRNRLKKRVRETREEFRERVEETRQQVEQARRRGLVLKVGGEDEEGVVVTDAKGRPLTAKQKGSRGSVLKKLIWAALLSIFMAGASVLARRIAGEVWKATLREEPPTSRK